MTFHELMATKARGRTGPLFSTDVKGANKAVTDAHVAKILERAYYEKHQRETPMSRWEVYDVRVLLVLP